MELLYTTFTFNIITNMACFYRSVYGFKNLHILGRSAFFTDRNCISKTVFLIYRNVADKSDTSYSY